MYDVRVRVCVWMELPVLVGEGDVPYVWIYVCVHCVVLRCYVLVYLFGTGGATCVYLSSVSWMGILTEGLG